MNEFTLNTPCPGCGYAGNGIESPHNKAARCLAKATDVPLRCVHCADPTELAAWPLERYREDGKEYRPVTTVIVHDEEIPVHDGYSDPDEDGNRTELIKMVPRKRPETVVDVPATLAGGPLTPPRTIPHVHRTCVVCGTTWPELLKG